jgi:RHS repeat-associated protein
MRDATNNFDWTAEGDDTLPLRTFYVQNWRADVVAVLDSIGQPIEELRYTAYGTPSVHPMADVNHDGLVNATDVSVWAQIQGGNAPTGVWSNDDLNRDELFPTDVGDDDFFFDRHASSAGGSYGFHRLSSIGNRLGYAGYVWDATSRVWHVRHRVLESESGKWTRMDPLEYVDGVNTTEYCQTTPLLSTDPSGLLSSIDAALRACFKLPTIAMRIECLEGLLNIFPGTKWDDVLRRMIDNLRRHKPQKPSKITRGFTEECQKLHAMYKAAEAACAGCPGAATECTAACANAMCWGTALALRKKYDKKCPSSPGHKAERENKERAKRRCRDRCESDQCKDVQDILDEPLDLPANGAYQENVIVIELRVIPSFNPSLSTMTQQ